MKPQLKMILGVVAAAVVIVLLDSLFIVPQTQQAIVIQFGEPKRVIQSPGLCVKIPFIQRVILYDNRLLGLDPPAKEVLFRQQHFVCWDWIRQQKKCCCRIRNESLSMRFCGLKSLIRCCSIRPCRPKKWHIPV